MSENFLNNVVMYCVKCRSKVNVNNPQQLTLKSKSKKNSSRKALKGVCPHCGTSTYKFIPKDS